MANAKEDHFSQLSDAIAGRVEASRSLLAGIATSPGRTLSGILWRADAVVTSEQALPDQESFTVSLPDGIERPARLAGRDQGTNVAVLRLESSIPSAPAWAGAEPRVGAYALALGARAGLSARLALIQLVGPIVERDLGGSAGLGHAKPARDPTRHACGCITGGAKALGHAAQFDDGLRHAGTAASG